MAKPVVFAEHLRHLLKPIGDYKLWPDNPRSGDLTALKESIRVNSFYNPVVAQKSTKFILAGNHRMRALLEMGEDEVPVMEIDVDDNEARRLALADNRVSDLAFYNDNQLFELLDQLIKEEGSLEGTGYDRAAYELLLQGQEADSIVGGVRQGVLPEERLDAYNELDIRSIILPYAMDDYEFVANALSSLRMRWGFEANADVVRRLLEEALEEVDAS
jgi:hypothetical protein